MTDGLGSILASFTNAAGGATLKGNQVFGPYGNARSFQGSINTAKGFTGQYNDSLTGLDYYGARYYDPVAGVFLSADKAVGNNAGANPYAYVGGNPESYSDPSGLIGVPYNPFKPGPNYNSSSAVQARAQANQDLGTLLGFSLIIPEVAVDAYEYFGLDDPNVTFNPDEIGQNPFIDDTVQTTSDTTVDTNGTSTTVSGVFPAGDLTTGTSGDVTAQLDSEVNAIKVADGQRDVAASDTTSTTTTTGNTSPESTGDSNTPVTTDGACSFTANTQVATDQGEQPIGKLRTGEKVLAYNPKTHQLEQEPILHVWVHTDNDLVDLTLTTPNLVQHGKSAAKTSEVITPTRSTRSSPKSRGFCQ